MITIRELLKPREESRYFDCAFIRLRGEKSVYIETRLKGLFPETIGLFFVALNKKYVAHKIAGDPEHRKDSDGLTEFEAQMLVDHYVETYGLPEQVTP